MIKGLNWQQGYTPQKLKCLDENLKLQEALWILIKDEIINAFENQDKHFSLKISVFSPEIGVWYFFMKFDVFPLD